MASSPAYAVAGLGFDRIAEQYDSLFTCSVIGRAQRDVVWRRAEKAFQRCRHVLELNCGTGEDALFLAKMGLQVTACDASSRMIERAKARKMQEMPAAPIEFCQLATERLSEVETVDFDGVFSNFSGLNCVADLAPVMRWLSSQLSPGAPLLLCLSTRLCLWEVLYYASQGNGDKAFRRWPGVADSKLGDLKFPVFYPRIASLRRLFSQHFRVVSVTGIGITVPPSYLEPWMERHPGWLSLLERVDDTVRNWPIFRSIGDHVLLQLEKA